MGFSIYWLFLPNWWFSNRIIPSRFISWHSFIRAFLPSLLPSLPPSFFLLPPSFEYISIDLFYSVDYNLLLLLSYFHIQISPDVASKSPVKQSSVFFDMTLSFLGQFSTFWHKKMFWVHLIFSPPHPRDQSFHQGSLVSFSGEWYLEIKIWVFEKFF